MAATTDDRRVLASLLILLSGITGAAFGRVFTGAGSTLRLTAAAVAAAGIATLLGRRHLVLSLLASAAGLVLAIALLVFPETTRFGVPTADTFRTFIDGLLGVGRTAAQHVAPAPPVPALLGVSVIALWTAATAAHALAVRIGSTVLGLLPLAVLLGFAGLVGAETGGRLFAAIFLILSLGVLLVVGRRHIRRWGPLVSPGRGTTPRLVLGQSARRLMLAATAIAVFIPGVLPGFGSAALFDPRSGLRVSIATMVDIGAALNADQAVEVFRVDSEKPAYWRLVALDRFDGRTWTSSNPAGERGTDVPAGDPLDATATAPAETLTQRFEIRALEQIWLPVAYQPIRLTFGARYDPDASTVSLENETQRGLVYGVDSQIVTVDGDDLDRPGTFEPPRIPRRFITLPDGFPPPIRTIARQITATAPTPYRQILAVQNYFRRFTYDETVPQGESSDHMVNFLEQRRGFCQQFSGTMAAMLRSLGFPARVAVGFTPGEVRADGYRHVTNLNAHAWVEVLSTYGWLAFEPTPTRLNPGARAYTDPLGIPTFGATQGEEALVRQLIGAGGRPGGEAGQEEAPRPGTESSDGGRGRRWPLTILLPVAAAVVLLSPLLKALARRARVTASRSPKDSILASYARFEEGARDLGVGRRRGETLSEYRDRLRGEVTFTDGHLDRITSLAGVALYSTAALEPAQASQAAGAARALLRDVRKHVGPVRVIIGAYRPSRR